MFSRRTLALLAIAWLLFWTVLILQKHDSIGVGTLDGVHDVEPQDEAVYSNAAIRMATQGEWSTPYFLGRFFLYKPPLVYWLSAASVKVFGVSVWALRLPSALAGALCLLILVNWGRESDFQNILATMFLVGSGFFELTGRNLTDGPLTFCIALCCFVLARDPALDKRFSQVAFCVSTVAAILLKSTAGLIPLLILGSFKLVRWRKASPNVGRASACAGLQSRQSPPWLRILAISTGSLLLAAPWFAYQYSIHPRWFWTEFVQVELLAYGTGAPPQQAAESAWKFYGSVLLNHYPMIAWVAPAALWGLAKAVRKREPDAVVVAVWIAVMSLAIVSFQYRNGTYLLPLCVAVAAANVYGERRLMMVSLVAGCFAWFLFWRIAAGSNQALGPGIVLNEFCEAGRQRELVIVDGIDNFHATVLPLHKVRYAFPGGGQPPKGFALDFRSMGIVMPVAEFLDLEKHRPRYAAELRAWGLPNDEALASVIAFQDTADLGRLIRSSPDRDFLVPNRYDEVVRDLPDHDATREGRFQMLRAKRPVGTRPPARSCRM
ncbi:MAG: glycosyltransferase family 39 protein [Bryobacteraceae bacterium]